MTGSAIAIRSDGLRKQIEFFRPVFDEPWGGLPGRGTQKALLLCLVVFGSASASRSSRQPGMAVGHEGSAGGKRAGDTWSFDPSARPMEATYLISTLKSM